MTQKIVIFSLFLMKVDKNIFCLKNSEGIDKNISKIISLIIFPLLSLNSIQKFEYRNPSEIKEIRV